MPGPATPVSEAMVAAAWRREQDPVAQLITITADADPTPIRVTDWAGGLTSGGRAYAYYPFDLSWAGASKERPFGGGKLTIGNVDQRIEDACNAAETPPAIDLALVRVSDPDIAEQVIQGARIPSVEGDATRVSAVIRPRDFSQEPACAAIYSPATTPGMF